MAESSAENTPSQPAAVAFAAASPSQSATPTNALVTAPPTPQLNAQLGSPEWQQALSQQVLMFHRNGQQSAELRLHPQELGALQITLQLDDKQAQLHIASAHGQVRAAVEAAMPQLRHALAESGINLGQSSVGGEATPQWQQQNGNGEGRASYAERHGGGSDAAPIEPVSAPAALQRMANQLNGVDIFRLRGAKRPIWPPFARLFRLLPRALAAIIPLYVIRAAPPRVMPVSNAAGGTTGI